MRYNSASHQVGPLLGEIMKKGITMKKPLIVKKVEQALRAAGRKAAEDHRRTGNPLIVWKDGKIVKIPASKL